MNPREEIQAGFDEAQAEDDRRQEAEHCIKRGEEFPFDGPSEIVADAALKAARGIAWDLQDRAGFRYDMDLVAPNIRAQMVHDWAEIIRAVCNP